MDVCIIPARMGSSRYPGKPLALILGIPMIEHVYRRCDLEKVFDSVCIATCDQEIADFCETKGFQCVMTSDKHERASDRVQEAATIMEKSSKKKMSTVTMVQGDEPMVTPTMLRFALASLKESKASVVNLRSVICDQVELASVNCVKVVVNKTDYALYFSRSEIPNRSKWAGTVKAYKQICIIPFTREFLDVYSALEPTPLEEIESVDMNRVLEHGHALYCPEVDAASYPVDVPEDVFRVEEHLKNDPLLARYLANS